MIQSGAGSAGTGSCTRREQNEVSFLLRLSSHDLPADKQIFRGPSAYNAEQDICVPWWLAQMQIVYTSFLTARYIGWCNNVIKY